MSNTNTVSGAIVVQAHAVGRGLLGRRRVPKPPAHDAHLYLHSIRPDGSRDLRRVVSRGGESPPPSERTLALYVATAPQPLSLAVAEALRDGEGAAWDLRLAGTWTVDDSRRFLQHYAADAVAPGAPLSAWRVQEWLAHTVADRLRAEVKGQTAEQARLCGGPWWSEKLNGWLAGTGLAFAVREAAWTSAEADALKAEAGRRRELDRIEQARRHRREAELREAQSQTAYEAEKARIAADQSVSDAERAQRMQLLELRHRRDLIDAEAAVEEARREAERAGLEHELTLARLHNDIDSAEKAESAGSDAERRHRETMQELAALRQTLEQAAALPGNLLGLAGGGSAAQSYNAVERLVTLHGIGAGSLVALGLSGPAQELVQAARRMPEGGVVTLTKTELRARDIGAVRVRALPVNTSLRFDLTASRPGCVTLLNVGTSGKVTLHVPSVWAPAERARVAADQPATVPGNPLMPWAGLRAQGMDYVEAGPPGWEHMVAFVTDSPLVDEALVARSTPEAPFALLTPGDIRHLLDRLDELPGEAWSAGVLSFLVE